MTKRASPTVPILAYFALVLSLFLNSALLTYAQGAISLTVTPSIFQLALVPGETWSSSIQVINSNPYGISIYASQMDFIPKGERGQIEFLQLATEEHGVSTHSLAQWIIAPDKPVFIPSEQSGEIPFTITIPDDAEPGGHYAAMLIGTQPISKGDGGSKIAVSSYISSLLFVRIAGDVTEEGSIREFSTEKSLYPKPDASFKLRFENTGNVHLLPRGDIIFTNMWGKERGRILINSKADFGTVLPNSIREYKYDWTGEFNFFDVGRYKAVATLSYGKDDQQNDYRTIYFWVIPIKPVLWILGSLFGFIYFVIWGLRRYIKRALLLETNELIKKGYVKKEDQAKLSKAGSLSSGVISNTPKIKFLTRPLIQGAIDLRKISSSTSAPSDLQTGAGLSKETFDVYKNKTRLTTIEFIKKYKLFFLFVLVVCVGILGSVIFFREVLMSNRDYKVLIDKGDKKEVYVPEHGFFESNP